MSLTRAIETNGSSLQLQLRAADRICLHTLTVGRGHMTGGARDVTLTFETDLRASRIHTHSSVSDHSRGFRHTYIIRISREPARPELSNGVSQEN